MARRVLLAVAGIVLSAFFVVSNGILAMQEQGTRTGAVYNVMGELSGVTNPHVAWLPLVGIVAVNTIVLVVLAAAGMMLGRVERVVFHVSFSLVSLALVAWSLTVVGLPELVQSIDEPSPFTGIDAWLSNASESTVTYVMPVLVLVALALPRLFGSMKRDPELSTAPPEA